MKSYEIGSRPAARKRRLISTTSFDQHCTKRYIQHDRSQASKAHICTSLGKKNGRELPDLQETCGQLHAWYDTEPAQHTPSFVSLGLADHPNRLIPPLLLQGPCVAVKNGLC